MDTIAPDLAQLEKATMRRVLLRLPVPEGLLLLRAARPRERRLCGLADEQGPGADPGHVRLRREPVLRVLLPGGSAQQPGAAEVRRQALDRPHHDHLGPGHGLHGVRGRTLLAPRHAVHPGRGRGRVLPGRDPLSHLLASLPVPRAHPGDLHRRDSAGDLPGLPPFVRPARTRRRLRPARVAVAVHHGKLAHRAARPLLPCSPRAASRRWA